MRIAKRNPMFRARTTSLNMTNDKMISNAISHSTLFKKPNNWLPNSSHTTSGDALVLYLTQVSNRLIPHIKPIHINEQVIGIAV
ncbi:MAG: hypothetical protein M9911_05655 [Saprospiraceae bacterium]|nr:hypothetical protein [Saprospiraceae bacterium]